MKKNTKTKKIFVSYSHKDEVWVERLMRHMEPPQRKGDWTVWYDSDIRAGDDWSLEIEQTIVDADAAILMISEDFLESEFIRGREVPALMRRRKEGQLKVFPLIIRPCDWQEDWLTPIEVRPKDKALEQFSENEIDIFLTEFLSEIKAALREDTKIVIELEEGLLIEKLTFGLLHVRDGKDQVPESGPLLNNELFFERTNYRRLEVSVRYRGNLGFQFKCFVDYGETGLSFEEIADLLMRSGFQFVSKGAGKPFRAWFLLDDYDTCVTVDKITNNFFYPA